MGACSATIRMVAVLPHPGMLPSGSSIASPECSRRRVSLSIDNEVWPPESLAGSSWMPRCGLSRLSCSIDKPAFPSRPGAPNPRRAAEGIGRSGATAATRSVLLHASMARMASTRPSPMRAPWYASAESRTERSIEKRWTERLRRVKRVGRVAWGRQEYPFRADEHDAAVRSSTKGNHHVATTHADDR
jgi:hypothetical protein